MSCRHRRRYYGTRNKSDVIKNYDTGRKILISKNEWNNSFRNKRSATIHQTASHALPATTTVSPRILNNILYSRDMHPGRCKLLFDTAWRRGKQKHAGKLKFCHLPFRHFVGGMKTIFIN